VWTGNTEEERRLIDKLHKIEALFARTNEAGERQAAGNAAERIRQRLTQLEGAERAVEFRFSLSDVWSRSLFVALLRRYGLRPYRYTAQRRTTVMVKVAPSFVDEVLWPEFQQVSATLRAHLDSVTHRIIQHAIHVGGEDVVEVSAIPPAATASFSR
jgi:hypothetical protein